MGGGGGRGNACVDEWESLCTVGGPACVGSSVGRVVTSSPVFNPEKDSWKLTFPLTLSGVSR